jgi:hypothetical protein
MNSPNRRAIADPDKIIWIKPERIRFKLAGTRAFQTGILGILAGDWDLQREDVEQTPKFRSIIRHFVEGADWEDTALFTIYAKRFRHGELVRGCANMAELKNAYDTKITQLYESLKTDGFQLAKARMSALPYVYVARDGEILFGREGNHRFAFARILKAEAMPCIVRARHEDWQELREKLLAADRHQATEMLGSALVDHPDLQDVIAQEGAEASDRPPMWQRLRKLFG